eukprot:TRINITY_DN2873_c0_g5_i1.p1 TRINITY_DN2873_c0_g5~~TRINITY_DN2873_c0_g5_i1.p1  ORF type:complete len:665 (-),score=96.21 TRINITY_DN2873_c0_g5_i1:531-2525(-)
MFFASGQPFVGCRDLDECEEYGYPEFSTCVNSGVNERTITCDEGFFITPPNDPVKIVIGNQPAPQRCLDFNECNYGCADQAVTVACLDSTSDPSIPYNTRVCTCPSGFIPYGGEANTSNISLSGPNIFNGCIDCSPCPFNSYLTQECNETHHRECEECKSCTLGSWTSQQCKATSATECLKCSECEEGYYIASPCTVQNDTVCLPCDPPCELPAFEVKSCTGGSNRVCDVGRTPQCFGGCGTGICVDTNVCECPLSGGYYGPNCELNCHLTCLKYSATCEISVLGKAWWCECPPGWFPNNDNQKCMTADTHHCLWEAWGEWSACNSCGNTRTREAALITNVSDASCGRVYPERQVCDVDCVSQDQIFVTERTIPGSGAYHALSLALFWQKNVAKFISAKHNVSLVLSSDIQADAFNERFRIFFFDPSKRIEMMLSQDSKRDTETDLCVDKNDVFYAAVNDVIEITQNYMDEVLLTPKDAVSSRVEGCELIYDVESPPELVIWSIFGGVVGGLAAIALVICLVFIWYKTRPVDLTVLPPSVRWQYEQYHNNPSSWTKDASQKFYKKELQVGTDDFQQMTDFFYGYLKASAKVDIKEAYAIYNPLLIANFINYRTIITSRMVESPQIFAKQDWKKAKHLNKSKPFTTSTWRDAEIHVGIIMLIYPF